MHVTEWRSRWNSFPLGGMNKENLKWRYVYWDKYDQLIYLINERVAQLPWIIWWKSIIMSADLFLYYVAIMPILFYAAMSIAVKLENVPKYCIGRYKLSSAQ